MGDTRGLILIMISIVVGLILSPIIISNAVTAATTTGIGSFAGVAAVVGLVPLGFLVFLAWQVYKKIQS